MAQQAVSADIIPNSAVGTFSPITEGTKTKAARVLISWLPRKFRSLQILGPYKFFVYIFLHRRDWIHSSRKIQLGPGKHRGKILVWYGEIVRKLAKLSMTTCSFRTSSYLFFGPYPRLMYSPKINLDLAENYPDGWQSASGRPKAARHQQQVSRCGRTSFCTCYSQCCGSEFGSNPHVSGPPGSGSISQRYGSGSFYHQAKIVRKTLISTVLWLLFDFLSLKNDVKVPSKSNVQKNFFLNLVFCWHLEGQWWK